MRDEDVIQKLRRMIYDGTGVPAHQALVTLDVAEAARAYLNSEDPEEAAYRFEGLRTALDRLEEVGDA